MSQKIVREGHAGRAKLSKAASRSEKMIDRYIKGESAPTRNTAYKLALACGCSDPEALALASEDFTEAKDRTA